MKNWNNFRLREGLQLRKVANRYMVVVADGAQVNLTEVYRLNESAACLWKRLEKGAASEGQLADWLAGVYGVEPERVADDVHRQLAEWQRFGLLSDPMGEQPMAEQLLEDSDR